MVELVGVQPGFLGIESAKDPGGLRLSISYWDGLESIANWKNNSQHQIAQSLGKEKWYEDYKVRICKVERDY